MRHYPEKVSLRFSTEQRAQILHAIALSSEAWRGISHHARQAVLDWAKREIEKSQSKVGRR